MKKLLALVLVMAFALIAGGAVADHTDNILYGWTSSPKTQNPHMYTSTTSSTRRLAAGIQPGTGILETDGRGTRRRQARPIPERELWFERVWRANREREEEHHE